MWGNADTSMNVSGGFMAENNAGPSDLKDDVKRGQNVVPLMIGHILKCNDKLEIWGIAVRVVSIVGVVLEIEEQTTKVLYRIEDDSGEIKAFYWIEADKKDPLPSIEINTYVQVRGIPRTDQDEKHIFILRITPLNSFNQFTCHQLEIIHTLLRARQIMQESEGETMSTSVTSMQSNQTKKEVFNESCRGLTKEQATVFKLIQAHNETESGIERNVLKNCVPEEILPKVNDIILFLMSEGHIYTTRTENHFKTT